MASAFLGVAPQLKQKDRLEAVCLFVFCKLPRLQGKPTDCPKRRPSGEEPCPGRARPRRGGTPPPQTARTNEGAPPRTGWPPTWSVSGASSAKRRPQRPGGQQGRGEAPTATPAPNGPHQTPRRRTTRAGAARAPQPSPDRLRDGGGKGRLGRPKGAAHEGGTAPPL